MSTTSEYSKDSPTRAGHLPKAQTEVANQVYSTEVRLNQRDLDGQQFQNKGQYSHSYQLIQSQDSAIASGIGQAQGDIHAQRNLIKKYSKFVQKKLYTQKFTDVTDTLNARSFSSGTIQEGKFNLKRTEDTSETDISIYNIIDGTIGRYIRELPIRTYIITAFLPFVIFLLWKFLIKYTPLSILVDKKKKKKRKKMNARLERILLDPSYQREKNIPLAYSPYEYYTY